MMFSIIVPIYNIEKYIDNCIKSVITQDFTDYELILVDDGSTDDSANICRKYSKLSQIRYYKKTNGGLSDARNYGLKLAKGQYTIFLDGDDTMVNGSLKLLRDEIKSFSGELDVLCCNYYRIENGEKQIVSYVDTKATDGRSFYKDQLSSNPTHSNTAWRNVYRTSFLLKNQLFFFFGVIHEDEEWTPRVFLSAKKIKMCNIVFYNYLIRNGSIMTGKVSYKSIDSWKLIFEHLRPLYLQLNDKELRSLLLDSLVNQYLVIYRRTFSIIEYRKKDKVHTISNYKLVGCCRKKRTFLKLFIYLLNKRLFAKI